MQPLQSLKTDLLKSADPEKAKILAGFFKTGKGQYGEGDIFLGIMVPAQRQVAKRYASLPLKDVKSLLASQIHEHRLTAMFILVGQYQKSDDLMKSDIANFYLAHTSCINNWDLVDLSAPHIIGDHFLNKDMTMLYDLAKSENLWERRIAIMATFAFIRKKRFNEALDISEMLLHDRHDLIHKAVGWMLREIGKRDLKRQEGFLKKHAHEMPRTMLRYAVECFDKKRRAYWMNRKKDLASVSSCTRSAGSRYNSSAPCAKYL